MVVKHTMYLVAGNVFFTANGDSYARWVQIEMSKIRSIFMAFSIRIYQQKKKKLAEIPFLFIVQN